MRLTSIYLKVNSIIEILEKVISVFIILAIVIVVFTGTFSRYIFNKPIYGVDRIGTYLMIWLGFIGFQIATSKMRHIEIEFLKAKVSSKVRYGMNIFISIFGSAVMLIFGLLSLKYTQMSMEFKDIDPVIKVPMYLIIMIIPISFFISSFRSLFNSFLWLDVMKGKRDENDIVKKQLM